MLVNKSFIDKNTGSSRIDKSLYREDLEDVYSFEDDKKI